MGGIPPIIGNRLAKGIHSGYLDRHRSEYNAIKATCVLTPSSSRPVRVG